MEDLVLATPPKTLVWPSELRARRARNWVSQLPIADSVEAAGQVYRALFHLNRSELEAEDRLELLALYVAPVASVADILSRHLASFSLPLAGSKRKLADFLRELSMEMAYGYKAALQSLAGRRWRRRPDLLGQSVQCAIRYLGEVLSASYRAYLPCPSGIWKEIHSLYAYAERHGLLDQGGVGETPVTIRERYLRVLLLGTAGPYQLPLNECARVESVISQCAGRAALRLPDAGTGKQFRFVVRLTEDAPPGWALPHAADANVRLLDVAGVVGFVNRAAERVRRGGSARDAGLRLEMLDASVLQLLERLLNLWATPALRRHRRVASKALQAVAVASGFRAAHYFISGQAGVEVPPERRLHLVSRDLEEFLGLEVPELDAGLKGDSECYRVSSWFTRDEGAGGLALVRDSAEAVRVQAGELVACERARGVWQLAVVRWLRTPDAQRVEMGLQLVPGRPRAVYVESLEGKVPALLLEDADSADGRRVFVQPRTLKPESMVSLTGWKGDRYTPQQVTPGSAFEEWRLLPQVGHPDDQAVRA
ncbi:MAG TPA: hypothetical protein VFN52_01785 [Acidiferrobacteraceae bacterium]|nr:hypothetical protein [Acidiferrobacteraceae bacterium]